MALETRIFLSFSDLACTFFFWIILIAAKNFKLQNIYLIKYICSLSLTSQY